jgi:hypothetical protein
VTTKTTFHLSMPRWQLTLARVRAYLAQRDPLPLLGLLIVAAIVSVALGFSLYRAISVVPATAAQPTVAAIFIIQTAQARPADRAAAALPTATPRLIVAFTSPNGIAFPDPIPEPQPSSWVGRWGDDWIEIAWAPNPIWIRAADIGARLADVRPVPAVELVPVAAPPPAPVAAPYQVANEPPAPIAPEAPLPADIRDWTEAQDQAYRAHLGLTDADMDRALAEHQAQQAAWCASGGAATQPDYCAQVRQWLEAR